MVQRHERNNNRKCTHQACIVITNTGISMVSCKGMTEIQLEKEHSSNVYNHLRKGDTTVVVQSYDKDTDSTERAFIKHV